MRNRWKWIVLIAIGVSAAAFWFSLVDAPVVTTLRLDQPATDGPGNELWFEVRSQRMVGFVTTEYSIEAQTRAGLTNYDAPPFGHVYARFARRMAIPIRVTVPENADGFRVKIVLEEFGAFHSRFEDWANTGLVVGNRIVQIASYWLNRLHRKGTPTMVWSRRVVKTNGTWVEQEER